MSSSEFYANNDQALRHVSIETRDHLGALAVQIVSSKHDLSAESASELVEALRDTIAELHDAYQTVHFE